MLQISAVLEEQVEPMYVCDFYPFQLIQFHSYDFFLAFFCFDVSSLCYCDSMLLILAFFAFLFNSPKH